MQALPKVIALPSQEGKPRVFVDSKVPAQQATFPFFRQPQPFERTQGQLFRMSAPLGGSRTPVLLQQCERKSLFSHEPPVVAEASPQPKTPANPASQLKQASLVQQLMQIRKSEALIQALNKPSLLGKRQIQYSTLDLSQNKNLDLNKQIRISSSKFQTCQNTSGEQSAHFGKSETAPCSAQKSDDSPTVLIKTQKPVLVEVTSSDEEDIEQEDFTGINPDKFKQGAFRLLHQHLYSQFIAKYPDQFSLDEDQKVKVIRKFFIDHYGVPAEEYAANEGIFVRLLLLFIYELPKIGVEPNEKLDVALREVFKAKKVQSKKDTSFLFTSPVIQRIWNCSWGGPAKAFGQSAKKRDMITRIDPKELGLTRKLLKQAGVEPLTFLN